MDLVQSQKCGGCVHWHRLPATSTTLGVVRGECRERLHSIAAITNGPTGPRIAASLPYYPVVAETFNACGQYSPLEVV